MIDDIFQKILKEEREANGLTQEAMAKKLNIPIRTYRSYEAIGKNSRKPDFQMLIKIADVLDTTTDYLLGRSQN